MKHLPYILSLIIVVLLAGIYILFTELRDVNRVQQSQIDHLKKTNEAQRDSLEKRLELTRDSLNIAFETIKQATAEREERHRITQRTIENLKRIVYIQHNDSSRTAELSKLYPSFKP